MKYSEDDIASNIMDLPSASSLWIMVRHQWLLSKMHSILTGEHAPALESLYQFEDALLANITLPENPMADSNAKHE